MAYVSHIPRLARRSLRPTRSALVRAVSWVEAAFRTARERRQLMALDEQALKDIGVSRADAYREGSRPFWDLPSSR
ncbi:MAG: DUF1127 domain-containing protein [Hyphomicrobium sp.]|uniref:DUF1127 domain-containing protein n=1 Tax=Hyphomicrobium sp. TaxID=82 RepID=UPI003D0C2E3B